MTRSPLRLAIATAAIAATLLGSPGIAAAHTEADTHTDASGATTVTLDVGHGCDAKPTVGLRVQLPAGATNVDAESPTGWTATVTPTELDWTGPALAADAHHEFSFSVMLIQPAGTVVTFPTIQQCTDGAELAWIETTVPGQPEPPHPAPSIVVGGSGTSKLVAASTTTEVGPTTTARMTLDANSVTENGSPTNSTGRIVFLVVCAVIAIGALALFLTARRRNRQP